MHLKYRFSPSIKLNRSTSQIMNELTLALIAVWVFAFAHYTIQHGVNYGLHIMLLTVVSAVTALVCEFGYAYLTKQDFLKHLKSSYPHVTVLILVLICQINFSWFAVMIGTVFAIVFAKLVFGGFGQNVFNPAGVGRVIIMSAFAGNVVADLSTGPTPIGSINSQGWTIALDGADKFLEPFGGLFGKFIGWHAGSLGETSILLLLLIGIVLIIRDVIDFRITVFYLFSVWLFSFLIALVAQMDLVAYPLIHVMSGGVMFAAVFMLTDPVTSPVNPIGRVIFAVGAGFLTVLIRLLGSTPGSVVYSILLMNMLVPLIDYLLAGNQIKMYKKAIISLVVLLVVFSVLSTLIGRSLKVVSATDATVVVLDEKSVADGTEYLISSKGFSGDNEFKIVISANGEVVSLSNTAFMDTEGIGDVAMSEDYLSSFIGLSEAHTDVISSATYSSQSVIEAVKLALQTHGGK